MAELADLYPGFASEWVQTSHGRIFARVGGSGPPLLLLHGYPQTHVIWHKVAPGLAEHFTLVIPDLPGYGWSDIPETDADHTAFTKRAMAEVMVDLMERLGHVRFALAGHDRGGRVAYRLALDHPGRVSRLAVLDIIPTIEMWAQMDRVGMLRGYHWSFLAQREPLPETLIGANPRFYFDWTLNGWGRVAKTIFDPRALEHYLKAFEDPLRIHAACEDYRAGANADVAIDQADLDAGRKITAPVLAIWGSNGLASRRVEPLPIWQNWATDVTGGPIEAGHFLAEENPDATLKALLAFFKDAT
jgi:haloacetate dehalogenase